MASVVTWWMYENGTGTGWFPSTSSATIEKAFQEGRVHVEEGDLKVLIPLMLAIDTTGTEFILVRKCYTHDSSLKPWQFEISYGRFVPMNPDLTPILTIARNAGYKKFTVRDESTFTCLVFDFENSTQTNADTNSMRTIIPAPCSKAIDHENIDFTDVPDHMLCPVTQNIMTDPVMAADGKNYERYSMENWFATGKVSSPLTGQTFVTPRLYPNHGLREQIAQWKQEFFKLNPDKLVAANPTKKRKRKASQLLGETPVLVLPVQ